MGREVRRVPADWQHPKNANGRPVPLRGDHDDRPGNRMPAWPEAERTHWQMYETTTAGTPLSPPCASPRDLAKWLADHHADAGVGMTATEAEWLAMIESGKPTAPFQIEGGRARPAFAKPPR
jgi:hypothetical protein